MYLVRVGFPILAVIVVMVVRSYYVMLSPSVTTIISFFCMLHHYSTGGNSVSAIENSETDHNVFQIHLYIDSESIRKYSDEGKPV